MLDRDCNVFDCFDDRVNALLRAFLSTNVIYGVWYRKYITVRNTIRTLFLSRHIYIDINICQARYFDTISHINLFLSFSLPQLFCREQWLETNIYDLFLRRNIRGKYQFVPDIWNISRECKFSLIDAFSLFKKYISSTADISRVYSAQLRVDDVRSVEKIKREVWNFPKKSSIITLRYKLIISLINRLHTNI